MLLSAYHAHHGAFILLLDELLDLIAGESLDQSLDQLIVLIALLDDKDIGVCDCGNGVAGLKDQRVRSGGESSVDGGVSNW